MSKKTMSITLTVFFIVLAAAFFLFYNKQYQERPQRLTILGQPGHRVAPFSFTDQDGKTITDKDLAGKIYVVEYFFTTCEGICPKMNENMAKVYAAYRGNPNVEIMSHTVDPETDTVAQMKAYSMKFDADPTQWHFVTGTKQALYDMAVNSYLLALEEDTSKNKVLPDFIHTPNFVLVDSKGFLRGKGYDGTSSAEVAELIADMKILLKEEEADKKAK
jgi:protein SCO1/2